MSIDLEAAGRFVLGDARLLDRHRLAMLLHGAGPGPALAALRAYRNEDSGFGHALEPDVRAPESETTATLQALELLEELGAGAGEGGADAGAGGADIAEMAPAGEMARAAAAWVGSVAAADGGVPFVLPGAAASPHAPWMVPSEGGSHLTLALAAVLWRLGIADPWRQRGSEWGWRRIEGTEPLGGYWVKFGLAFLDAVPDGVRAAAAIETLRPRLGADGSLPVPGGTESERLRPLTLSPTPGARSRALFAPALIEDELDRLEAAQEEDGGWSFDWLAWCPGQEVEWRGKITVDALRALAAHGRIGRE
jgi:hypothetical protein